MKMNKWPVKPLINVLQTFESGSRPKGGVGTSTSGVPSLGGEHLTNEGDFDFSGIKYVSEEFFEQMLRGHIQTDDILIVKDGATTGKTAFVSDNFPYQRAAINEHVFLLRPKTDYVLPKFLFYFLSGPWGQTQILACYKGSAIGGISKDFANSVQVPLPPLPEQERIIRILDEADQLRRLREESDRRSKDLIPSTFHEMFGDTSVAVKNCKVVRLEEVTTRITDGVHLKPNYTSSGIPFISVKDITTGKLKFDDCKFISREDHERFTKRCKPEYLDILYTKVGATYGRPALVDTSREFSIYVSVCLIKPNKNLIEPQFLNTVMGTAAIKGQADQAIKGIGVPDLHLDQIKNFLIPLPSLELQRKFTDRVAEIKAYEAAQAASWAQLDRLFLSLHHSAFHGEL